VLYRCNVSPVVLNSCSELFTCALISEVLLHLSTEYCIVIIRVIVIVRNEFACVSKCLNSLDEVIRACYVVALER
jgi:hypothetical protein